MLEGRQIPLEMIYGVKYPVLIDLLNLKGEIMQRSMTVFSVTDLGEESWSSFSLDR